MTAISIRSRFHSPVAAGALALILVLIAQIPCATAAQDPSAFITTVGTQGIEALRPDVSSSERLGRFRQLLQEDFDLTGIGLFALGRYRASATPQEQQEYLRLYPDFTVRAFSARLNQYGGHPSALPTGDPLAAKPSSAARSCGPMVAGYRLIGI